MADIKRIRSLEAELRSLIRHAEATRKILEKEYAALTTDERQLVEAMPVTDAPDYRFGGDADKANGKYFRWWVKDYHRGKQCIEIDCPTFLRGRLHLIVEKFQGAGY